MDEAEGPYLRAALAAAGAARAFLEWMEAVAERLSPERSVILAAETERRHGAALAAARAGLDGGAPPAALEPFATQLAEGFRCVEGAFVLFTTFPVSPSRERISRILGALGLAAGAAERFYGLRLQLAPFADFWPPPPGIEDRPAAGQAESPTGVIHVSGGEHHGGFALYVPEHYDADRPWPLIVALHGGSGNGREFLWTWLRDARHGGYLLVAPSSLASTWSEVEDLGIREILAWLGRRYRLDPSRVLLTGLSDGASMTLLYGLLHPGVYRALAPLCGVLHPANHALGNLERARGVPIYLVHGALDFLFPVETARMARDTLDAAGAALEYRELADLSHTYPRSENARILEWFAALPAR